MTKPLAGQVALVTGASRGFGFAAAKAMGTAGAHVVAVAKTVGGLEELDDAIKSEGGEAVLVPLDICDDAGLERMCAALHERFGRADIWLHTACHAPPLSPAEHMDAKDLDKTIAVNIRAFQRAIRAIDPLLRLSKTPRAVIASDNRSGQKFFGPYAMSKAAQSAITQAWAAESGQTIKITEFEPAPMPTALRARFFPGEDRTPLANPEDEAKRFLQLATA
ncbi:MAG: SDR family NAD(P)-dependent oxidoreductase [Pseudomonadota bacterium]